MIGVGVANGKMDVRLLDPLTAEEPVEGTRPELQEKLRAAIRALNEARVEAGVSCREHGISAPETKIVWSRFGDIYEELAALIRRV